MQRKLVHVVMRLSIKTGTRWIMRLDELTLVVKTKQPHPINLFNSAIKQYMAHAHI